MSEDGFFENATKYAKLVAFYSWTSESGKDSAGDFGMLWAAERGLTATRSAFADEMKIVCADALGIDGSRGEKIAIIDRLKLHGSIDAFVDTRGTSPSSPHYAGEDYQVSGRNFIIGLAESIRRLDESFWIRHAISIRDSVSAVHFLTDLRFQPEADWVRQCGGVVVEIHRSGTLHRNEDRIEPDYFITNDGELRDLRTSVFAAMDTIWKRFTGS